MALNRENFLLHKLHSLTGIVPIGFYMVQHLTLNSFSLAGPDKFNAVIAFFEGVPKHLLLAIEILVLGIPILFHGIYGLFITQRADVNVYQKKYRYAENWMYFFQRVTGVALFFLIILHVSTTTIAAKYLGRGIEHIQYAGMQQMLVSNGYLGLILYAIGVLLASYHLAYGLWNFCIRWGITVSDHAQVALRRFSFAAFVAITALGWAALAGFLIHEPETKAPVEARATPTVVHSIR
ncbi:MAG: hypothetical protein N2109_11630 [Fimbriimonadales bacterium]|nr:hypothetical protein [Fimbriimonadales bacterium]